MEQVMNISFEENELEFLAMQDAFNELGADALYYSHHELAAATEYNALEWRAFLSDPRVQDYFQAELNLIQQSSIMKMMRDIDKSKSTGQAQLLNTLVSQSNSSKKKEGPIFIYSYIPLNAEEVHAPNVETVSSDPFKNSI